MRGGIRPPFIDRKVMRAPKMTKEKLATQVSLLQAYIDEREAFDKSETATPKRLDDYAVARWGWGGMDDMVHVSSNDPDEAVQDGTHELGIAQGDLEYGEDIILYRLVEIAVYEQRNTWVRKEKDESSP